MKDFSSLLLVSAAVGVSAFNCGAAPLNPEALLGPSKPTASYRFVSEAPTLGASTTLEFYDHPSTGYVVEEWGKFGHNKTTKHNAYHSATAASRRALSTDVKVLGQLIYDEGKEYDPDDNDWLGFYYLPHSTGANFTIAGFTNGPINRGGYADFDDNVYRGIYLQNMGASVVFKYMVTFDLNTFETISAQEMSRDSFVLAGYGVAKNPADNKVYGCYINPDGSGVYWGTGDYIAGTSEQIKTLDLDQRLFGLTFTDAGVAYGLRETSYGSKKLELVTIDPATGDQQVVGPVTVPYQYSFGCCWNEKNKTILVTFNTEEQGSGLMEINPETCAATLLSDFEADRQVVNLFVMPDRSEKVPAAPQLTVTAPEGSMTCNYTITLPETLVDGTPMTGLVEWRITLDGEVKFEGANQAGSSSSGTITIDKTGWVEFLAYAYNKDGQSANTKARLFVGKGLAAAPQNVNIVWNEETSTMTGTWDAVTTSADGGYINPAEVTYTITDMAGNLVAENVTTNTFAFEMEQPGAYTEIYWLVTANYDGRQSAAGQSNSVFLGSLGAPYEHDFTMRNDFESEGYIVIDANGDGCTFQPNGLGARCGHSDQKISVDDWLVLPALYLETGNSYVFTLAVHCYQATDSEIVEVKYGTEPTVASMTTTLISQTTVKSNRTNPTILTGVLTPSVSGKYSIGIHAKSSANKGNTTYHVMVPHISVSEPVNPNSPVAPTNVKLNAFADGALRGIVTYTAPSKSMGGTTYSPMTGDMIKMLLYVGDSEEPVQSMTVAPGYSGQFPQPADFDERGDHTVTVVAETVKGGYQSLPVEATSYVGPYEPKVPTNVRLTEVYQPGTVKVEWDPVTLDINGNALPAGHTTYMIFKSGEGDEFIPILDEPLEQTSYVFDALEDVQNQEFVQYWVAAYNWDFMGRRASSTYMPVGVPMSLPVKYSNRNDMINNTNVIGRGGYGQFFLFAGDPGSIDAQDGDGEFLGATGEATNDYAILRTGIISLVGAKNPEVVLYTYSLNAEDRNIVQVAVYSNGYREVIRFDRHTDMTPGQWNKCRFDLSKWRDKNVQIEITMGILNINRCYVDNISIQDTPDYDLAVTNITAPKRAMAGRKFDVSAIIENVGMLDCPASEATLYCNDEVVETRQLAAIDANTSMTIFFSGILDNFVKDDMANYRIEVTLAEDGNPANNVSADAGVARQISTLAGPETLNGESTEDGLLITWEPIIMHDSDDPVTEDFETADSWADYYGNWTFIDRDGSPLGGINEIEIPGIEHGVTKGSFFVFDMQNYGDNAPQNLNAHSGDKFLFSLYRRDDRSVDDWAISPLLNGQEQTISFYAKSLTSRYPEQIEVLYTFEDDFQYENYIKVDGFGTKIVPQEWTLFTALIPAEATHFAIRSRAAGGMMLMVDDVTFTPMFDRLLGYNLYRDGILLNKATLTEPSYLDTKAGTEAHTYHATAVYDNGESELSQPLMLQYSYSGLSSVTAENFNVKTDGLDIILTGAGIAPVTINSVDGRNLHKAMGDTRFTTPAPGVYLLTVGSQTIKVIVK